jgi:hypothetical protein
VGVAIDLDGQGAGGAIEVYDESVDGMLSSEFEAAELPISQMRPQLGLGGGLRLVQLPGASQNGWIDVVAVFGHLGSFECVRLPLTPALSLGGEGESR